MKESYEYKNIFSLCGIKNYEDSSYLKAEIKKIGLKVISIMNTYYRKKELNEVMEAHDLEREASVLKSKNDALKKVIDTRISDDEHKRVLQEIEENDEEIKKKVARSDELRQKSKGTLKIRTEREKQLNDFLDSIEDSQNINALLLALIEIKGTYYDTISKIPTDESPIVDALKYANQRFKTEEDIKDYITNELNLEKYVDFERIDFSKRLYKPENRRKTEQLRPQFLYSSVINDNPILIGSKIRENGSNVRVYDVGKFGYSQFIRDDIYGNNSKGNRHDYKETYNSDVLTLLSVVVEDKNGKRKVHNLVMSISQNNIEKDEDFYMNVVFSDLVISNAEKNNAGFIGTVVNSNGTKKLTAESKDEDTTAALSYALSEALSDDKLKSGNKWNVKPWNCINPRTVFDEMNVLIELDDILEKKKHLGDTKNNGKGER